MERQWADASDSESASRVGCRPMSDYKEMIVAQIEADLLDDVIPRPCWDCGGKGKVRFVNGGSWGNEAGWMKCPTCKGEKCLVGSVVEGEPS